MDPKKLRKKSFVNRKLQGKFLTRLVGYWAFYHLVLWHSLFVVDLMRNELGSVVVDAPRRSFGELYANFAEGHKVMLFLMVAMLPVVLRDMVRLTHQVAGPLVRFRDALRKLADGQQVEKIKLRDGDLLTEFQDAFNAFLASERLRTGWPSERLEQTGIAVQESLCLDQVTALQAEMPIADRSPTLVSRN